MLTNKIKLFLICFTFLSADVYEGYMLYTPGGGGGSNTTRYEDWDGNLVHSWSHGSGPASMPYFLASDQGGEENSLLYYPSRSNNPTMDTGGVGGRVEIYTWDGEILYTYNISSTAHQHHHDIAVLPNGNFIVVAWERLYASEWQALGRTSVDNNIRTSVGSNNSINNRQSASYYSPQSHLEESRVESISGDLQQGSVLDEHERSEKNVFEEQTNDNPSEGDTHHNVVAARNFNQNILFGFLMIMMIALGVHMTLKKFVT